MVCLSQCPTSCAVDAIDSNMAFVKTAAMFLGLFALGTQAAEEHPVRTVLYLLEELQAQAEIEGEQDANTYQKFT